MLRASVDLNVGEDLLTEASLREHALDSVLDELDRVLSEEFASLLVVAAAWVAAVEEELTALLLVAGEDNLGSVDDYDVVTAIDMRCEVGLVLTAEELSHYGSESTEHDV